MKFASKGHQGQIAQILRPKEAINTRITIPLVLDLGPDARILMFMWSFGPLNMRCLAKAPVAKQLSCQRSG